ncbi:hypothetical protein BGX26_005563 [Mortierella sp. AD094]|nr:hypothetical protein BGX26_005563 [Mortierella sp. AD094]
MVGDNTSGLMALGGGRSRDHNYSHRRVGSSYSGPLPERGGKDSISSERDKEGSEIDNEYSTQQQPDWWSKKSPLEYFQQVPPMEELYGKVEDRPKSTKQELESNEEQSVRAAGVASSLEQALAETVAARNPVSPREHATYTRQDTPLQSADRTMRMELTAQPSAGFYDSLEAEQVEVQDIPSTSAPPPIPKATRPFPISDPIMIAIAADQKPVSRSDQEFSTQTAQPMPLISPKHSPSPQHFALVGPWGVSPKSTIARLDSDI